LLHAEIVPGYPPSGALNAKGVAISKIERRHVRVSHLLISFLFSIVLLILSQKIVRADTSVTKRILFLLLNPDSLNSIIVCRGRWPHWWPSSPNYSVMQWQIMLVADCTQQTRSLQTLWLSHCYRLSACLYAEL